MIDSRVTICLCILTTRYWALLYALFQILEAHPRKRKRERLNFFGSIGVWALSPHTFLTSVIFQVGSCGFFSPEAGLRLRSSYLCLPSRWGHSYTQPCPAYLLSWDVMNFSSRLANLLSDWAHRHVPSCLAQKTFWVTSSIFYWLKQVTTLAKYQRVEELQISFWHESRKAISWDYPYTQSTSPGFTGLLFDSKTCTLASDCTVSPQPKPTHNPRQTHYGVNNTAICTSREPWFLHWFWKWIIY
jgi:hypothetical protein